MIREIRLATGLSQRALATRLQIPLQTYRPFDSGRRAVPHELLQRAESSRNQHRRDIELLTIDTAAREYHTASRG
jgi:transcriptional regulator with XRE-family HTH domain